METVQRIYMVRDAIRRKTYAVFKAQRELHEYCATLECIMLETPFFAPKIPTLESTMYFVASSPSYFLSYYSPVSLTLLVPYHQRRSCWSKEEKQFEKKGCLHRIYSSLLY